MRTVEFVLNDFHRNITDDELLNDVKRVSEMLGGEKLSAKEYRKHGKYGINTFIRRFGGWNKTLELCGIEPSFYQIAAAKSTHSNKKVENDELLADVKRVATELGVQTIHSGEYSKYGKYSKDTCLRRYKTWNNVLEAAGLIPYDQVAGKKISQENLFIEIERLWILLGRQPTTTDIVNGISKYSLNAFTHHFGGWRAALEAFVQWINSENSELIDSDALSYEKPLKSNSINAISKSETASPTHKTNRNINLRLRFLVMKRDNFKCCLCGASPAKDPSVELHIDHIKPWSKGGETTIDNLRTLCSKCNFGKSNMEG